MALERLAQAKALLGFLARGVRDVIRPQEDEGFAPSASGRDDSVERPLRDVPTTLPSSDRPVASASERTVGAEPSIAGPLVTPPPADPALLEAVASDLSDPQFSGMRVVANASHVAISWRAPSERLAAARGLTDGPLGLRLVAVRARGDDDVEVDTLELGPAETEGSRVIARPASMLRAVASVGLGTGPRFVSVAHADAA